mmetsp:Transcript_7641/g.17620  ORF Transcript_7641/g.17620 Transcript_7641/m.17620 type:complete len:206 (-) Transcript_7641:2010-2627(-)
MEKGAAAWTCAVASSCVSEGVVGGRGKASPSVLEAGPGFPSSTQRSSRVRPGPMSANVLLIGVPAVDRKGVPGKLGVRAPLGSVGGREVIGHCAACWSDDSPRAIEARFSVLRGFERRGDPAAGGAGLILAEGCGCAVAGHSAFMVTRREVSGSISTIRNPVCAKLSATRCNRLCSRNGVVADTHTETWCVVNPQRPYPTALWGR